MAMIPGAIVCCTLRHLRVETDEASRHLLTSAALRRILLVHDASCSSALANECESTKSIICIDNNETGAIGVDRQGRLTECNVLSSANHIAILNLAGAPVAWEFSTVPALISIDHPSALGGVFAVFVNNRTFMRVNADCSGLLTGKQVCPTGLNDQSTPNDADSAQDLALA